MQEGESILSKKNNQIPVIINCDGDVDDMIAIMMAIKNKVINLKLIATTDGNISSEQSATEVLNVLKIINAPQIPVAVFNDNKDLTENQNTVFDAIEQMYNTIQNEEQKTSIVCTASTTIIAEFLKSHNDCKEKIREIIIISDLYKYDNNVSNNLGLMNIKSNIDSFEYLLNQDIPITLIPADLGIDACLDWEEVFKTKNQNYAGECFELMFRDVEDKNVKHGIAIYDSLAVAYLIKSKLFETKNAYISFNSNGDAKTFEIDFEQGNKNLVKYCINVNVKEFKKLYFCCLKKCK